MLMKTTSTGRNSQRKQNREADRAASLFPACIVYGKVIQCKRGGETLASYNEDETNETGDDETS